MLYELKFFESFYGPLRLMGSHLILMCLGATLSLVLTLYFLPKLWNRLPRDRGKAIVKDGMLSLNKPTGAGIILLCISLPILFFVLPILPFDGGNCKSLTEFWGCFVGNFKAGEINKVLNKQWIAVLCLAFTALVGFFDDKATCPWGRSKKFLFDVLVSFIAAISLCGFEDMVLWMPFIKNPVTVSWVTYVLISTAVMVITINCTNCSDGVDGLAGSLVLVTLFAMSIFLYGVVGHEKIAQYLLLPHNPEGARWAILTTTFVGSLVAYLWYNAEPSSVLMGDAGSRMLGLLLGITFMVSGNPFLILLAICILINGGTGLVKLLLLNVLKKLGYEITKPANENEKRNWLVRIAHRYQCPIHDHLRHKKNWSKTQILVRFVLLQAVLTPLVLLLMIKLR